MASVIPVVGFATLSRFDLAQRLLDSIDYPIEHLVIVDNSGRKEFSPIISKEFVRNLWLIQVPYGLGANGAWNLIIKSTPYAPYWVLPNDDSYFEPGALEIIARDVDPEAMNFVDVNPAWSCVIPGQGAIATAGLWDEAYYPIYFDDDDLERRQIYADVPVNRIAAKVHHDNSSTLRSGYQDKNKKTFRNNQKLLETKRANDDYSVWGWDLVRRRENKWD